MKKLSKIKNSFISRQISVARIAIKTGRDIYKNRNEGLKNKLKLSIEDHVDYIVDELGIMKGSLMKAGQMLSIYGAAFLPEKAQNVLKTLENQSSYLDWHVIKEQLPSEWITRADIEETPLAAASLGQVHLAQIGNVTYAMKIQYKGVRKAIRNDIRALKLLLKAMNLIPSEINLTEVYKEIEAMLYLETDYHAEAKNTAYFKAALSQYPEYEVPEVLLSFSSEKVLTTSYMDGSSLHSLKELNISQEKKNILGRSFLKLLFLEIFILENVQSDAHPGNYLLLDTNTEKPRWGLLDFGATKSPDKSFLRDYQELFLALVNKNKSTFLKKIQQMNYISSSKQSDLDLLWDYAQLIGSPFYEDEFNWGNTDLSDQIMNKITILIQKINPGNPPVEAIFIDRKIAGVYFILQKLQCRFNVKELFNEVYKKNS